MTVCLNIYSAVQSYKAGSHHLAAWAKANPGTADIIVNIREMRQNAR